MTTHEANLRGREAPHRGEEPEIRRVKLQTAIEAHEAVTIDKLPAGRWAYVKTMVWRDNAWSEVGPQYRCWDPWSSGGFSGGAGTEAKAHYMLQARRWEFFDMPC